MSRLNADDPSDPTETLARASWLAGDFKSTATAVLEGYGAELYSFLLAQFRSWDQADDVFSTFKEDLWKGLPSFQWRCSIRAWCYRLARNAASRYRRTPQNRRTRHVSFDDVDFLTDVADRARTSTQAHLRSEVKSEVQKLRDELTQADRDLLALRVDRALSWREIAHAMLPADEHHDDERVRRLEAALRQRFVEIKNKLQRLAKERGLL